MVNSTGFLNCYERDELNQLSNQMETINLRFTLDAECPIDEYGLCESMIWYLH
jgi:hypothetical protein